MKITFNAIGLCFEADVDYEWPTQSSLYDPGDSGELVYSSLTCDGVDASFLEESSVIEDLDDAAWEAIADLRRKEEQDAAAERYAARVLDLY